MSPRPLFALLSILAFAPVASLFAQDMGEDAPPPPLVGKVVGKTYVSPTGVFKIDIPVLPELGGEVSDTPNVVTFQDDFNVHISVACFPMDAQQRWEHETRGRKDYLIWFFSNVVQSDFETRFPGAKIESARYNAAIHDGAIFTFNSLPGGSMFEDKVIIAESETVPVAKRGNLLFVKNEHVIIISAELAEKVLERSTYKKTVEQEDEILRTRLMDLLGKMTFSAWKKPAAATPAPKAPAAQPSKSSK